jgi:hypothetical protein
MNKIFKRNQRWKTRDGRLAVIDTVRGRDSRFPIQGRVKAEDGTWYQRAWTADGMTVLEGCCVADYDLIAPWPKERKPREFWVVLYKAKAPLVFTREQDAMDCGYASMADGFVKVREVIE